MRATGWQLKCTTGNANKYYRIAVAGSYTVYQYGRVGNVQAVIATDHRSTLVAQDAAWKQSKSKERTYHRTHEETVFDVEPGWLTRCQDLFSAECNAFRGSFQQAITDNTVLRGELTGVDAPRVVGLRCWQAQAATLTDTGVTGQVAGALVAHRSLDIGLAVLPGDVLEILDARYTPRLALTDLGPARPGDTTEVLASALTMFDPAAVESPGELTDALLKARLVHA